jgi:myosin regulatory light chain 12
MDDLLADRPGDRRSSGVHSRVASFEADSSSDRGITFPMFLTMMGEHLYDFDTEAELLEAFECFDEDDTGLVKCDEIRRWLGDVGEKMDQREVRSDSYHIFYRGLQHDSNNICRLTNS